MHLDVLLARLDPGKLNPRKNFNEQALAELTGSIMRDGILENLIVRPEWCVGLVTAKDMAEAHRQKVPIEQQRFEIVSGERRYRAALRADVGPEKMLVPVRVKPMTDPEALGINLTEQLQRNQLTPLEEAQGFADMLAFKDEKGLPLHTVESVADKLSVSHDFVLRRKNLLKLSGSMKKALNAGTVAPSVAELVSKVPDETEREKASTAVLTGGRDGQPMTYLEAQAMLNEKFMLQLRGAPFDQEDAELVPAAGKCSACPYRTGNIPELVKKKHSRPDVCTNPACYRSKCDATFSRLAAEAERMFARVLSDAESAKLFETHRPTEVRFNSDWVEISTKPMAHLLKADVTNPPVWNELALKAKAAGMKPDIVLAKDGAGRGRWLVNSAQLVAAAEKLGEPIFRGQKGDEDVPVTPLPGEDANDTFRRGQREHAKKQKEEAQAAAERVKKSAAVRRAAVVAVHRALAKGWVVSPIWNELLDMLIESPTIAVCHLLAELLKLGGGNTTKEIRAAVMKGNVDGRQALVPLLLLSEEILEGGVECTGLRRLATFAEVDLMTVETETLRSLKPAKKKPVPAKAKKPAPKGKTSKKRGAK